MFYTYLRGLVAFILWVLNGNAHYHHKDNIPDQEENYILVSPHLICVTAWCSGPGAN